MGRVDRGRERPRARWGRGSNRSAGTPGRSRGSRKATGLLDCSAAPLEAPGGPRCAPPCPSEKPRIQRARPRRCQPGATATFRMCISSMTTRYTEYARMPRHHSASETAHRSTRRTFGRPKATSSWKWDSLHGCVWHSPSRAASAGGSSAVARSSHRPGVNASASECGPRADTAAVSRRGAHPCRPAAARPPGAPGRLPGTARPPGRPHRPRGPRSSGRRVLPSGPWQADPRQHETESWPFEPA